MKTHIIITGHARSFERCWPNIRWNVINRLINPIFHVSIHPDDEGKKLVETLESTGYEVRHEYVEQPNEWADFGNAHLHAPYAISVPISAILGQLWRMQEGYNFARHKIDWPDIVVRLRPDLWFHQPIPEYGETEVEGSTILHPWWGNFGGLNDRFAIMGSHAAEAYFATYSLIESAIEAGCPLHPESLVSYACMDCKVQKAPFLFSTIRATGQQRWPEILPGETPPIKT